MLGLADDYAEVVLPGGPLLVEWRDRTGSVLMTGPAEAVFDGVLTPALVPAHSAMASIIKAPAAPTSQASAAEFDCSKECADKCQRPDHCLRDEEQQKVQAFLSSTSLDSMLNLASESLEQRTKARFERGTP